MQTFTAAVTNTWAEVLQGSENIAFDVVAATPIRVYFTEGDTPDSNEDGNPVHTWPPGWDFTAIGMPDGQMIWVKTLSGTNIIVGTR